MLEIVKESRISVDDYVAIRKYTEEIVKPLQPGDFEVQPEVFVSPAKWHLAHTTWFFEEFVLKPFKDDYELFNEDFSFLFNSYYNNVGERVLRADRGNLTRPILKDVYSFREYVDYHMKAFLKTALSEEVLQILEIGLQHEQQHQELLFTDIKYILSHNPLFPVYDSVSRADLPLRNENNKFIKVEEGVYPIGHIGNGFSFDNENSRHNVFVHEYEIAAFLVTNGDFIEFINSGGYQEFNYWLDEGWQWVNTSRAEAPLYWHRINGEWFHFTLGGMKPIKKDDVLCHVNFYEAMAFAEWKGMRLPTEQEWEIASSKFTWGGRWEWTNSAYLPYPGFEKKKDALGEYNGKFMVNQMVLRGASVVTSPGQSRSSYRNFFHPHYQWQFSGIRLAKKQKI